MYPIYCYVILAVNRLRVVKPLLFVEQAITYHGALGHAKHLVLAGRVWDERL